MNIMSDKKRINNCMAKNCTSKTDTSEKHITLCNKYGNVKYKYISDKRRKNNCIVKNIVNLKHTQVKTTLHCVKNLNMFSRRKTTL